MAHEFVEGWTERIRDQLSDTEGTIDLTLMTVVLLMYDREGAAFTFAGTAGIDTAATGIVYFDPNAADLQSDLSPYSVRWKVTDVGGKIAFFPNQTPEKWTVRRP